MGLVQNKDNDMTPFKMSEKPCKQYPFLMPLVWGGAWALTRGARLRINKVNMKGVKPPFFVIATHQGPMDYYVGPLALFPHRGIYVSDMEGFAAFGKWLYRGLGCIGKRRYVSDLTVLRNMKYALSIGQSVVLYPESRHSNVGTTAYIPKNIGRCAKLMAVPVVTLTVNGNYLSNPFWDEEHTRKVPVKATMTCICNNEELEQMDEQKLQALIEDKLSYDEYRYQRENNILIKDNKRAEGLHKALYQCRSCGSKYKMQSSGSVISCQACRDSFELTADGWLAKGEERIHIPDWYEWQRKQAVDDFLSKADNALREYDVYIYALPNEKGFVDLGNGKLSLNQKEFELCFDDAEKRKLICEKSLSNNTLHFPHNIRESVQTEYDYKGTGMCIVLSTSGCCYYIYSKDEHFNPTELQFIGEAMYQISNDK